jgi:hypothetical protein
MSNFLLPLLTTATIVLALPAIVLIFKRRTDAIAPAVVALVSFLMSTPVSKPLWDVSKTLQETQFPWRWMTITSACVSLLITITLPELVSMGRTRLRPLAIALIGLVAISTSFTIFQLIRGALLIKHDDFNARVESLRGSTTNPDFLPLWVREAPQPMNALVESEGREVTVNDWSAEHKVFTITPGTQTNARLKLYYYPYWVATANGTRLTTDPAPDGALLVSVPREQTTVDVKFTEPSSTYAAAAVSIIALVAIALIGSVKPRTSPL